MERNRWETAIRCLEIAVHPNTSDKEVIAAVHGFRRIANSTPLSEVCRVFAERRPAHLLDRLDQLNQENRELRRKVAELEANRALAFGRLQETEQRAQETAEELLAAEQRAEAAERRLREFEGVYGRISGGLRHENLDLRRAFDEARHNLAQPIHEPIRPFQNILNTALRRADQAPHSAPAPAPRHPWAA